MLSLRLGTITGIAVCLSAAGKTLL